MLLTWVTNFDMICEGTRPLCGDFTGTGDMKIIWFHRDRWIPRTTGQLRGKCFHLMTSSCSNITPDAVTKWNHMYCLDYILTKSSIVWQVDLLYIINSDDGFLPSVAQLGTNFNAFELRYTHFLTQNAFYKHWQPFWLSLNVFIIHWGRLTCVCINKQGHHWLR